MIDRQLLELLDAVSEEIGDAGHLDLVVVGGTALILQGLVRRLTKDVDVLGELIDGQIRSFDPMPSAVRQVIDDAADLFKVERSWLNTGPASQLHDGLPRGFVRRLRRLDVGPGMTLWLAGRVDLIWMKLYAATDVHPMGIRHLQDLKLLGPSDRELKGRPVGFELSMPLRGSLRTLDQRSVS